MASFVSQKQQAYLVIINKADSLRFPSKSTNKPPNSYAKITCDGFNENTKIIKNTVHPEWDECVLVCLSSTVHPLMKISIHHTGSNVASDGSDVFLGEVCLDLTQTMSDNGRRWHTINCALSGKDGSNDGFRGNFNVLFKAYTNPTIKFIGANKLKNVDGFFNLSDPYAKLCGLTSAQQVWFETNYIKDNLNPIWNEVYTLRLLENMPLGGALAPCRVVLADVDNGRKTKNDTPLGEVSLPWQTLFPDPDQSTDKTFKITGKNSKSVSTLELHCSMPSPHSSSSLSSNTSAATPPSPSTTTAAVKEASEELLQQLKDMEEAHAIKLKDEEERYVAMESRLLARAEELESKILNLEKEKADLKTSLETERQEAISNDISRQSKILTDLKTSLETEHQIEVTSLKASLSVALSDKADMITKIREQDNERRKLHNSIQELRGSIRVFARVRPFLIKQDGYDLSDSGDGYEPWLRSDPDGVSIHALSRLPDSRNDESKRQITHTFQYDHVFDQKKSQEDVFLQVSEFVQSALDGYNVCLFSYGQTGSGKTHTMTGSPHGEQRGIIPRTIEHVANRKIQLEDAGWTFKMEISFLEIYCEEIYDLLGPSKDNGSKTYRIITNEFGQHVVENIIMVPIDPSDKDRIDELMKQAASLRSVTATKMNEESSRSHSIFTLHLTATHEKQGVTLHGQLNLVDLAGSERVEKSEVTGQGLTEASKINTSLSTLSKVFLAIGNKNSHIPFRDSKLTRLLEPALSTNGKTLMILNLSPIETSLSESISSLRFGTSVNSCELGKATRVIKRRSDQGAAASSSPPRSKSPPRSRSPAKPGPRSISPTRR